MEKPNQVVVFALDEQRYALPLSAVDRVVRLVDITPLPKAPEIVLGVINVGGQVVPLINARQRFRLPTREFLLSDHIIVARTARRPIALVADTASGIVEYSAQDLATAESILPGIDYVQGVVKLKDGLLLIHDLDRFLSLDEERSLGQALEAT